MITTTQEVNIMAMSDKKDVVLIGAGVLSTTFQMNVTMQEQDMQLYVN